MKTVALILLFLCEGFQGNVLNSLSIEGSPIKCITTVNFNSDSLPAVIKKYINKIDTNEVPYIVRQSNTDSTLYFVCAFIYTNSIVKNPPTAIIVLNGREVLYYDGSKQLSTDCQNALIRKYRRILHIDKMNTKHGEKPGTVQYYTYDPVWVKIKIVENKVVGVTDRALFHHVPLIDHSF